MEGPDALGCGACGATNSDGAGFCRRCGRSLNEVPRVAAAAPSDRRGAERSWDGVRSMLVFCGILLASSLVGMIAMRQGHAAVADVDVALTIFWAVLVAGYAIAHRRLLAPLLGRFDIGLPLLRDTLFTAAALGAFAFVYFSLVNRLGIEELRYLEPYEARGWPLWTAFLLVSIAPGIVEEIAFRGIVMERLRGAVGAREAWLIQAALFAVLHLSPLVFVSHFVIGLLLGWLRRRTRSLYPGMVVHAGYNAAILISELVTSPR